MKNISLSTVFIYVSLFACKKSNDIDNGGTNPPPPPPATGTVQQVTFTGPITNKPVTFSIYLPPGYNTNTTVKYPVVYHLHGIGGKHNGNQITSVPTAFELAKANGLTGEVIIIFPDGYNNSMWSDSYTGLKPAETNVIKEILPYVDANYRTIADRQHRFIEGFSMGGFGALKLFTKFPDLFYKVVSYDGAVHNWTTLKAAHPDITAEIFNNDSTLFNSQASPWTFLQQNAVKFKTDTLMGVTVGALTQYNQTWKGHMDANAILYKYIQTTCAHNLDCLLQAEGNKTALFFK